MYASATRRPEWFPHGGQLMLGTIRKTANLIGEGQWKRWLLLIFLAVLVSIFEMVGAALVYVLITVISSPEGPIEIPLLGDVRDQLGDLNDETLLIGLVVGLGAFFLFRAGVRVGTAYAQARVAYNAGARLSNKLTAKYLGAPYAFHLRRSSAELLRNSHTAVNQIVNDIFLPVIRISAETLVVMGLLAVMLAIAPLASLIAAGVIGGSAGLLLLLVQPRLKRLGRTAHLTNQETLNTFQQALHGIRDVKMLDKESWFARLYAKSRLRMARAFYLRSTLTELPRNLIELSLFGFILVYFALTVVTQAGSPAPISILGLFAYVGLRLQPSIQKIIAGLNSIKFANAPLDELDADLRQLDELPRRTTPMREFSFADSISLEEVSFRYEGAHDDSIRGVNLRIPRGFQVGICGPTGGGKTTLVDLITGLHEPTTGRVTVDGKDIKDNVEGWRANLGVVPQDVFLLDDTLRRNIAFGVPDDDIDGDVIDEVTALAQIRSFITALPDGLDTSVGERGVRISGGQRQRIAIARALYHKPEVLVFDEGTSALDNETEEALMEAIERLRGSHTIILVAHRLSTVRNSDSVVVVEDGRIIANGKFDAVMQRAR